VQGGCEEDETVASPGDEETRLINDGEYEDREEKCEADFEGHGSPVNNCYGIQGAIRNIPVTNYPTHNVLLQGNVNDAIVKDRDTDAIKRDVDQSEHDDTDMEEKEKEKEEIDEHTQARESSVDEDDDDEEEYDNDETPSFPVQDIESEVCKNFLLVLIFPV
jgi:hypothetical protein